MRSYCIGKYLEYIQFRDSHEQNWAKGQPSRQEAETQKWVRKKGDEASMT